MLQYERRVQAYAVGLAALAGFVDALGFLKLGGFFISFMSGNSTRLAVGLAENARDALIAGGLIAAFVAGVVLGSLTGHLTGAAGRRPVVLLMVSALLAAGAALDLYGHGIAAIAAIALAMGAENAIFERDGEVTIGLTYMTGTLVKMGQRITGALTGGSRTAWIPYLMLWLGLVLGAAAGATAYVHIGLAALWFAAGGAFMLAVGLYSVGPRAG